jgi:hypothetical protein
MNASGSTGLVTENVHSASHSSAGTESHVKIQARQGISLALSCAPL